MTDARIALDAMGGDEAPEVILRGAVRACSSHVAAPLAPERILLVGDRARIESGLNEMGGNPGFSIRHASEVIEMGDSPATALRSKPDSSIGGCVAAVRSGEAASVVSMGNTGAVVGASTIGLGTLEGVRRPAIAVTIELTGRPLTLLDMGANVAPKPEHLLQFGLMGATYAQHGLGVGSPRVGLLNIGEESGKGTDLLKEAYGLLASSGLEFVGNVEPGELFIDRADVLVTDGFTGNIVLKLMEGFAGFLFGLMRRELSEHHAAWGGEALGRLKRQIDYSEYGGALLLGVRGVVVIGHGRSDESAVANALAVAARTVDAGVNALIVKGIAGDPAAI
ncbi:phosphate acyltransferase [Engelhardtia mirabilis]|uniref:Phosphate acyltransferase n=1 Tax=Engelhardtia mirabilis TaxID=2528011 RepID=A0A518BKM3_9BACT|nr:Phosphate acyltransferase [Planctomycetes bacterium Pla133]QDV01854.1 Phosphate acyltransferase [Planctomycetes bacterium Pla86]